MHQIFNAQIVTYANWLELAYRKWASFMWAENPFFSPEGLPCFIVRSSLGFSFLFILVFKFLKVYYLYILHFYLIIPSLTFTFSYNPPTPADPLFFPTTASPSHVCFCCCWSCASGHSCCMFMTAMAMSHSEVSIL